MVVVVVVVVSISIYNAHIVIRAEYDAWQRGWGRWCVGAILRIKSLIMILRINCD